MSGKAIQKVTSYKGQWKFELFFDDPLVLFQLTFEAAQMQELAQIFSSCMNKFVMVKRAYMFLLSYVILQFFAPVKF